MSERHLTTRHIAALVDTGFVVVTAAQGLSQHIQATDDGRRFLASHQGTRPGVAS